MSFGRANELFGESRGQI